jgi:ribonuclease P protein component
MTGEGSHDFARVRRIVKTDEFSSVFRLRPAQKTAHFVLYTRPNALPHARLGVVAAKRFAPRAVTRNTIKRVTRELFRTTPLPGIDCIVRLARPVNAKNGPATTASLKTQLRAELARLFASQLPRARKHDKADKAGSNAAPQAASTVPSGSQPGLS